MMVIEKKCLTCGMTILLNTYDGISKQSMSFCCDECQQIYYESKVLEAAKEMGIDVPINDRFEILDL